MSDIQEPLPWGKSSATVAVLEQLVADRLLPRNPDLGAPAWISPRPDETEPKPPQGYVVSFVRLHERGFGVPASRFMRALCDYYEVELHNFSPNAISQAAVFVAVCEGYLGIEVHWDLWIHLFRGELFVENARNQPRRYARAGGLTFHIRPTRRNFYITSKMTTNNSGWSRGWFYLRNHKGALPEFTNKVLRERPPKWDWGVSPPAQQARLEVLTDALARLARKGLTAAAVIANFHRQRVIPLVERALPIYELTPGSKVEGSRTSSKLLSHTNAARRAKYAVAEFPQDSADLWRIKMRPEPGYISLVSFGFELVVRRVVPLFLTPSSGVFYRG